MSKNKRKSIGRELRQIIVVCIFFIVGCIIGYFLCLDYIRQVNDPHFIAYCIENGLGVPDKTLFLGFRGSVCGSGMLFSAVPTSIIFYRIVANKYLTTTLSKIIIGLITYPFFLIAGVLFSIPFVIYKTIVLLKNISRRGGVNDNNLY